jgi:ribonuclease VapC
MIVVDSSAIVAILFGEPSAGALVSHVAADPERVISVASYLEVGTALAGRRRTDRLLAIDDLDAFWTRPGSSSISRDMERL